MIKHCKAVQSAPVATSGRRSSVIGHVQDTFPRTQRDTVIDQSIYRRNIFSKTSGHAYARSIVVQSATNDDILSQEATQKGVPTSSVWELDFCSRPIIDERGKKVWELLICDPDGSFEYSQFFPNNKINSTEVCPVV